MKHFGLILVFLTIATSSVSAARHYVSSGAAGKAVQPGQDAAGIMVRSGQWLHCGWSKLTLGRSRMSGWVSCRLIGARCLTNSSGSARHFNTWQQQNIHSTHVQLTEIIYQLESTWNTLSLASRVYCALQYDDGYGAESDYKKSSRYQTQSMLAQRGC